MLISKYLIVSESANTLGTLPANNDMATNQRHIPGICMNMLHQV
ncbi:hypothetical protein CPter91_3512 [Collimonas pratensis]|uniref:Uncharacterized protein n=1 Tax=Collimonas pratensis TaxID=279113 RepID=A0A127Q7L6_9BURK|nr:hypothetical protein CPter91_3512 [Collimonas pratensis]